MRDIDGETAATLGPEPEPVSPGDSRALYLNVDDDWIHARYHPAADRPTGIAVVICGPFGFDDIASYRPLREWARRLSVDGHAVLRLSPPGVGDSGGDPSDPDRLRAWTQSVDVGARWLRATSSAHTVVAIGIGLGGVIAYQAASVGASLDGLVLWGAPVRGADVVRQLRAFARLESSEFFDGLPEPPALPEGMMEAGGFLMSADTVAALTALDLSQLPAPTLSRGVLVLSRDGVGATKLVDTLRSRGLQVSEADGTGFGAMTAHPQTALAPETAIHSVAVWLSSDPAGPAPDRREPSAIPDEADELRLSGGVSEREFVLATPEGRMRGILCAPDAGSGEACAVFFNAGGVRRIGPNRMWVEASRRWAQRGVTSLRIDMPGLGESDGPTTAYPENAPMYGDELIAHARSTIDELAASGVADRFVLVGLCAGGYWALHSGLADERVTSMMLVNPGLIVFDEGIGASRDVRRVFSDRSWRRIRKNATPRRVWAVVKLLASMPARAVRRVHSLVGGPPSLEARVDATLERLRFADTRLLMAFGPREGLADDLRRNGWMAQLAVWPNVTIRDIPVNDHTVRPITGQQFVHAELDAELDRVLHDASSDEGAPTTADQRAGTSGPSARSSRTTRRAGKRRR